MKYACGADVKVGDKVLGERVKGHVTALLADAVEVCSAGAWDPKAKPTEVRAPYAPEDLVLAHRYPEKPRKK